MRFTIGVAATFIASASAHATFQQLWINGVDAGSSCIRAPTSNSPVTNVLSNDIACNIAGTSAGVCPITAGDEVTVEMHQQPGDRSCKNEAIGGAHYGPVTVYMAKVADAKTAVGSSADWFKVSELGLVSNNPTYWGSQVLNDNCGHYTFKVPADIAPGNYLIRADVLALHAAGSPEGGQFYPACYQVTIAGSGTAEPPTVKLPGAFSSTDPGILINIHNGVSTYEIPGPTPYGTSPATVATTAYPTTATWNTALQPSTVPTVVPTGGSTSAPSSAPAASSASVTAAPSASSVVASSSAPSAPTSSSAASPPPTAAVTTVVTTSSTCIVTSTLSSAQSATTGTVPLYGQCGGVGFTGPKTCAQGICKFTNDYYSQCVPGDAAGGSTSSVAVAPDTSSASSPAAVAPSAEFTSSAPATLVTSTLPAAQTTSSSSAYTPAQCSGVYYNTSPAISSSVPSSASSPASSPASLVPTTAAVTPADVTISTTRMATSTLSSAQPATTGTVSLYGQCGGVGFTGAKTCAEGSCKIMNDFYSQCVL